MENMRFDLFLPVSVVADDMSALAVVAADNRVNKIFLWCPQGTLLDALPEKTETVEVVSLSDSALFVGVAEKCVADFAICMLKDTVLLPCVDNLYRMGAAMDSDASMLYCDYYKWVDGEKREAPTIDCQIGSVRNDFDFGPVVALRTRLLKECVRNYVACYNYAGFYQMRLALGRVGCLQHLGEYLYSEREFDLRKSGERQFDYVNPAQRDVQIEMEAVCTEHLKAIGAWLPPYKYNEIELSSGSFPVEASVVIPVLNRVSTIADAIKSVLSQETDFKFNILVVDNHSTDGTSEVVDSFDDERVCHLIPEYNDLGIGGCWNYAVNSELCGRFAVQLDSDDIYSGTDTLQRIVDEFYKQRCVMLIGSYRICNFNLDTLPPGVIDHREWSEENGRNNALRINGLGAPRAFFTPVVREVGFPNVSYGEDYAVGLQISRKYRIGRIYDVLYLCRRWEGNSDSSLSHEKINAHNSYKDSLRTAEMLERIAMLAGLKSPSFDEMVQFFEHQLDVWPDAKGRFDALKSVKTRALECGITLQYNPSRIVSAAAKVDAVSVGKRPCFLCAENRPSVQRSLEAFFDVQILVNPFPILPMHLTLPLKEHVPQRIKPMYRDVLRLADCWPLMALFYNGAKCGASAPDHAHLQAVYCKDVPLLSEHWERTVFEHIEPLRACGSSFLYSCTSYLVPLFIVEADSIDSSCRLFEALCDAMPLADGDDEPMMNLLVRYIPSQGWLTYVFPRKAHRPACYYVDGKEGRLVSPGLLDVAGLMIAPRVDDFENITSDEAVAMLREVAIDDKTADEIVLSIKS